MLNKKEIQKAKEAEQWFFNLVEEIRAIIAVKNFNANYEVVEGKWLIGRAIEETIKNIGGSLYGKNFNKKIAEAVGLSEREIFRCRQFYSMFPYQSFEEVSDKIKIKQLNWKNVTNLVLPQKPPEKQKEYISVRIDEENKTIFIKIKYQDYRILYY